MRGVETDIEKLPAGWEAETCPICRYHVRPGMSCQESAEESRGFGLKWARRIQDEEAAKEAFRRRQAMARITLADYDDWEQALDRKREARRDVKIRLRDELDAQIIALGYSAPEVQAAQKAFDKFSVADESEDIGLSFHFNALAIEAARAAQRKGGSKGGEIRFLIWLAIVIGLICAGPWILLALIKGVIGIYYPPHADVGAER
jgi:hypothetical protein